MMSRVKTTSPMNAPGSDCANNSLQPCLVSTSDTINHHHQHPLELIKVG